MEVINGFRFLTEQEALAYTQADMKALIDDDMTRGSWLNLANDPEGKIDADKVCEWKFRWQRVKTHIGEHNQKILDKVFPNVEDKGIRTPESKIKFVRGLFFDRRFDNLMNKLWDNNSDLQYLLKLSNVEHRMKTIQEDF